MHAVDVWREAVFEARLKYLAFKRTTWLLETVLLIVMSTLLYVMDVKEPWRTICICVQLARVITEMVNHRALAHFIGAPDHYTWFPLT